MSNIFVTGATGFIGRAVIDELLLHNYKITALARSDDSTQKLEAKGIKALRGTLEDIETLKHGAANSDGVIHLAFIHKFDEYEKSAKIDAAAISAIGNALEGTNKPFIVSSAVVGLDVKASDGVAIESDVQLSGFPRKSEQAAIELVKKGVRFMSIRLPPTVHGIGDGAFIQFLIKNANLHKKSVYLNVPSYWSAVHVKDAAKLYRLSLENGKAGSAYHAIAEQGVSFKDIAEHIAKKVGVDTKEKSVEEAGQYIGFLAHFGKLFKPASSVLTRAELDWTPVELDLISDLEQNYEIDGKVAL